MTARKIMTGDPGTPQARVPKRGTDNYIGPVMVDGTSGTEPCFEIEATIEQSVTAGYSALFVNVTETSTGSGTKLPIDVHVGGVSLMSVDNAGKLTCAAFTSTGIDDNATKKVVQAEDSQVLLGDGTSSENYHIGLRTPSGDALLTVGSDDTWNTGTSIVLYSGTHATNGYDIRVYANNAVQLAYDHSESTWDFLTTDQKYNGLVTKTPQNSVTAFAGGGQANAVLITNSRTVVTVCATIGDSLKLPTATEGAEHAVVNTGAASLALFPNTSDEINALGVNNSLSIAAGAARILYAVDGTTWITLS